MPEPQRDPSKVTITIIGAGIAGLTAAQELVLRGFKVNIVDPQINDYVFDRTLDMGVGGMARSQYVAVLNTLMTDDDKAATDHEARIPRWQPSQMFLVDEVIAFVVAPDGRLSFADTARAKDQLKRFATAIKWLEYNGYPTTKIWLVFPTGSGAPSATARKAVVLPELAHALTAAGAASSPDSFFRPLEPPDLAGAPTDSALIAFFWNQYGLAPGEHGFRFFPSFYRHLFDTMKRTTIVDPYDSETGRRTVFDNLIPSECLGLARDKPHSSFTIPRSPLTSFEDVRKYLRLVLDQLGYTLDDIARYSLALFKFMTSSSRRRREQYENMSWGDFVELDRFSPDARVDIEFGPQMTAALRGSQSDARTQGNITVQLVLDQLRQTANVDCTLDGPTSSAWLDHWRAFLLQEQVKLYRGRLTGVTKKTGAGQPDTYVPEFDVASADIKKALKQADYFILALDLPAAYQLATSLDPSIAWDDCANVIKFVTADLAGASLTDDLKKAAPVGPLQHLSGIQFYFDTSLSFWRGHTQYVDTPWGLTSVAQPQFWLRSRDPSDPFRSILSIDIGIWDKAYVAEGTTDNQIAWDCPFDRLAKFTWQQIKTHHEVAFRQKYGPDAELPRPIGYALDRDIDQTKAKRSDDTDHTPFLVNRTARYTLRPGKLAPTSDQASFPCYNVFGGQWVMCGTFMQTFTRLTSMEGANESARHAVNAVLKACGVPSEPCEIWDPEANELPDLAWLRELDEQLLCRGLPHFVDILGWRDLPLGINTQYLRGIVKGFWR
jgi:hypothetical protein